ncbi:Shikimate 5-dehydrogenase I alpha (EC [Olavius sp. associated proteobacterium Delta 1]|nr:Shikimate 5-dehydrogenase I alpha (EC [Olavius sp. associated proteobacterium Delta 1]
MKDTRLENNKIINPEKDIATFRKRIDDIDEQILELISRRLSAAQAIGQIKQQAGITVVDDRREGEIYQRLLSLNQGAVKTGSFYRIFRSIIAAGRGVQNQQSGAGEPPIYAVFGDPVGHSLSPAMHNSALAQAGLDGFYIAIRVKDLAAAVSGIRGLGIRGASITIPHKISIMKYLDQVDSLAADIGAVNTIVNRQGLLCGYNSDCAGAIKALAENTILTGEDVAVVGAGGGARAVGFGIKQEGGRLTIINRTPEKGEKLASDLDCEFKPLSEVKQLPYHIIINATSAGMTPNDNSVPLNTDLLESEMVVMDMVYNPLKTRFMAEAEKNGCIIVDGVSMFVQQGAVQFELWTGKKAPLDVMRKVVLDELSTP